jgi:geranylgeranyl pyrophosphate synthase
VELLSASSLLPSSTGLDALVYEVEMNMERLLLHGADSSHPAGEAVDAALYHLRSGGRRIRSRLALHASLALGISSADAVVLATAVEFLHNASLVHDDLQDDELLRHGIPTTAAMYGTNIAICAGDLLISAAYAALVSFSQATLLGQLITLVHTATATAIRGQCAGFQPAESVARNLEQYHRVAIEKSGALLSLPLELALIAAHKNPWLPQARRAAEEFAVGYQIMDDLQDVDDDGPTAMNIVAVLKAQNHGANAAAVAHELGVCHLKNAADFAEKLPNGSGALLATLATTLGQS